MQKFTAVDFGRVGDELVLLHDDLAAGTSLPLFFL